VSDQPQQPEQEAPAGQPVFSQPMRLAFRHACESCGHQNEIAVQFGGILQPIPPPRRVQSVDAVSPADEQRMRRGPMGLER